LTTGEYDEGIEFHTKGMLTEKIFEVVAITKCASVVVARSVRSPLKLKLRIISSSVS